MLEIADWDKHFENNRTRDMKHLRWLPMPNKHDGEGYTELMSEDESGPEDYAAWCLMAQVASKCEPRGKLVKDDGSAMTPQSLARKTRAPARIFEHAIPRLLSIGWLRDTSPGAEVPQEGAAISQDPAQKGREGKGTEENRTPTLKSAPANSGKPVKRAYSRIDYPPWFEELWTAFNGKDKTPTWKRVKKLVAGGVPMADLVAAAKNYQADDTVKRGFKKGGARFYGPEGHWQDYVGATPTIDPPQADIDAVYEKRAEQQRARMRRENEEAARLAGKEG